MRVLALLSGGVDSVTMLHALRSSGHAVEALTFNYGQRHMKEIQAARYWALRLEIPHHFVDLPGLFSGSALTGDCAVPHGHYSHESMQKTVVPNRNMVFLSIAITTALQRGMGAVAYAAHASDAAVYWDCRPGFVKAMQDAACRCDRLPIQLLAPFLTMSKKDIVKLGRRLGVDYSRTWSCYEGGEQPCGKCGPCVARAEVGV